MKTRTKIILTIVAATAWFLLTSRFGKSAEGGLSMSVAQMQTYYAASNEAYFNSKLPPNTVIEYSVLAPDTLAQTTLMANGKFKITLNTAYTNPPRYGALTLLHEECHILTWPEIKEHGPDWQACMTNAEIQGAFRHQLIDGDID